MAHEFDRAGLLHAMLKLLVGGEDIHHPVELSLERVGRCPAGSWTDREQRGLDRFAAACFQQALQAEASHGFGDPLCLALMFVAKLLSADFQAHAARRPPTGCLPFGTMVDTVFDMLCSDGEFSGDRAEVKSSLAPCCDRGQPLP